MMDYVMDETTEKYLELRDRYDGPDGVGTEYMRAVAGAVDYNPFTARWQGITLPEGLEKIAEAFKQVERLKDPDAKGQTLKFLESLIEVAESD